MPFYLRKVFEETLLAPGQPPLFEACVDRRVPRLVFYTHGAVSYTATIHMVHPGGG